EPAAHSRYAGFRKDRVVGINTWCASAGAHQVMEPRVLQSGGPMPLSRRAVPLSRRRLLALGALAAGAAAVPWPRRTATAAADPMRAVLANGLVVIVDSRADGDQVALQLTARVGARDDTLAGITALTSRLIFAGTARRPSATALQGALAEVGGTLERKTEIE